MWILNTSSDFLFRWSFSVNQTLISLSCCSQKMSNYHGGQGQNYHGSYNQSQSSYYGNNSSAAQGGYYSQWGSYDQYSGYNNSYNTGYNTGYNSGYNYNYGAYGYPPPGHMMPPPPMGMPPMSGDMSGAVEVRGHAGLSGLLQFFSIHVALACLGGFRNDSQCSMSFSFRVMKRLGR